MNETKQLNKSGYIDGNKHKYLNLEEDLLETKSITRLSDNVKIEIDPYDKQVYMRMRHSYYGYKNAGREYYENQAVIAAKSGVSESKLKSSIKKWKSIGLIEVETIRTARGNKSNSYIVTSFSDVSEQYQLDLPLMAEEESEPGNAMPNLKEEQPKKHDVLQDSAPWDSASETADNPPPFGASPSDYQNVPSHYYDEEDDFWSSVPIASSKPAPKHSPAAALEGLLGGVAPANRTPTASAVDEPGWYDEPF